MKDEFIEKIVTIIVKVKVKKDFDVQQLAVCKYEDNTYDDTELYLPKTEDFEVVDYIDIEEDLV